jgi:diaminopimelate dehydrogenase
LDKKRLAVIGFGRVGRVCADLVLASQDLVLSGIVRRPDSLGLGLPDTFQGIPVVAHLHELKGIDGALLCVPPEVIEDVAREVLRHKIPLIDCAIFHDAAFQAHKDAINRLAHRHHVAAILGAGWDPGAVSLIRSLFAILTPIGHTTLLHRSGKHLHHTITAESVSGVKAALCTEIRTAEGKLQRYVYIELEDGADRDWVIESIKTDPVFLGEETLVFPVESVAALEEQGKGIVLERRGASGRIGHQHLLLEARLDVIALTAQMMIAAARVLPMLGVGAFSLL